MQTLERDYEAFGQDVLAFLPEVYAVAVIYCPLLGLRFDFTMPLALEKRWYLAFTHAQLAGYDDAAACAQDVLRYIGRSIRFQAGKLPARAEGA